MSTQNWGKVTKLLGSIAIAGVSGSLILRNRDKFVPVETPGSDLPVKIQQLSSQLTSSQLTSSQQTSPQQTSSNSSVSLKSPPDQKKADQ